MPRLHLFVFASLLSVAGLNAQQLWQPKLEADLFVQTGPEKSSVWLGLYDNKQAFRPLSWVPVVATNASNVQKVFFLEQELCLISYDRPWIEVTECFTVDSLYHARWNRTTRVDIAAQAFMSLAKTTTPEERWQIIDGYHQDLTDPRLRQMGFSELPLLLQPLKISGFKDSLATSPEVKRLGKFFASDAGKSLLTFRRDAQAQDFLNQIPGVSLADLHLGFKWYALERLAQKDTHTALMLLSRLERSTPNDEWVKAALARIYQTHGVDR